MLLGSDFPHSRQGRLRESEQPRAVSSTRLCSGKAMGAGSTITIGQGLKYRERRRAQLEHEAASHGQVVIGPKGLAKMVDRMRHLRNELGQVKKQVSQADWWGVMEGECSNVGLGCDCCHESDGRPLLPTGTDLSVEGDADFAQRLFAHFLRVEKEVMQGRTFKSDRRKLFVNTVPILAPLSEVQLRRLKDMVSEVEVREGDVVVSRTIVDGVAATFFVSLDGLKT